MRDILACIRAIQEYVRGMTFEQFVADRKTADAAVRNIITIGEAAANVPSEIKDRFPHIPWDNMRRM